MMYILHVKYSTFPWFSWLLLPVFSISLQFVHRFHGFESRALENKVMCRNCVEYMIEFSSTKPAIQITGREDNLTLSSSQTGNFLFPLGQLRYLLRFLKLLSTIFNKVVACCYCTLVWISAKCYILIIRMWLVFKGVIWKNQLGYSCLCAASH